MPPQIETAEEEDAFTWWRRYLFWQRGDLKRIKRRLRKRERRCAQAEIRAQQEDR